LFPRVAAVVHHGGAGTMTAAARAGVPQVIAPRSYDQPYRAHRVETLGVGARGPASDQLSAEAIVARVQSDGARVAAARVGAARARGYLNQ
jgi:vancomycin aglycone glucosyltransferase